MQLFLLLMLYYCYKLSLSLSPSFPSQQSKIRMSTSFRIFSTPLNLINPGLINQSRIEERSLPFLDFTPFITISQLVWQERILFKAKISPFVVLKPKILTISYGPVPNLRTPENGWRIPSCSMDSFHRFL